MRAKTLDLENVRRLDEVVKDGVYALPTCPSDEKDEITRQKIQELKRKVKEK